MTIKKNKWTRNYKLGYYTKMKFSEKHNTYTYFYGGGWRTPEGIKKHRKLNDKCSKIYWNSERGFFTAIWNNVRKSCDENSYRIKVQGRSLKINNGIKGTDHLLEIWEKQKKRLGGPYCAYTGVELTTIREKGFEKCKTVPTNLSIDRIDGSLPYQEDNIVFCSWEFNNRKNSVSIEDCKLILKTWKEKQNEYGQTTTIR